ncbi:PREDICTED: uncharacterized protein LOC105368356 [Ceratosolen solmsi marchali]|uniref:Uncharacterized protein LOC105368356 n=1 Tax=Ceratosolen solmsi marchali TaxID=326594 RepID=A0AAJ7E2P7_9HYME|nr:PREDICTED: uncharacterized protein LOC105368356 [Ceratosolen solmsi marchali]
MQKYFNPEEDGFLDDYSYDKGQYLGTREIHDIRSNVPGEPGIDYPAYVKIPKTMFSCINRKRGYYADEEAGCQVFHVCEDSLVSSFLCPVGSLFSQQLLTCDWWSRVSCTESHKFYNQQSHSTDTLLTDSNMLRQALSETMDYQKMQPTIEKKKENDKTNLTSMSIRRNENQLESNHDARKSYFRDRDYKPRDIKTSNGTITKLHKDLSLIRIKSLIEEKRRSKNREHSSLSNLSAKANLDRKKIKNSQNFSKHNFGYEYDEMEGTESIDFINSQAERNFEKERNIISLVPDKQFEAKESIGIIQYNIPGQLEHYDKQKHKVTEDLHKYTDQTIKKIKNSDEERITDVPFQYKTEESTLLFDTSTEPSTVGTNFDSYTNDDNKDILHTILPITIPNLEQTTLSSYAKQFSDTLQESNSPLEVTFPLNSDRNFTNVDSKNPIELEILRRLISQQDNQPINFEDLEIVRSAQINQKIRTNENPHVIESTTADTNSQNLKLNQMEENDRQALADYVPPSKLSESQFNFLNNENNPVKFHQTLPQIIRNQHYTSIASTQLSQENKNYYPIYQETPRGFQTIEADREKLGRLTNFNIQEFLPLSDISNLANRKEPNFTDGRHNINMENFSKFERLPFFNKISKTLDNVEPPLKLDNQKTFNEPGEENYSTTHFVPDGSYQILPNFESHANAHDIPKLPELNVFNPFNNNQQPSKISQSTFNGFKPEHYQLSNENIKILNDPRLQSIHSNLYKNAQTNFENIHLGDKDIHVHPESIDYNFDSTTQQSSKNSEWPQKNSQITQESQSERNDHHYEPTIFTTETNIRFHDFTNDNVKYNETELPTTRKSLVETEFIPSISFDFGSDEGMKEYLEALRKGLVFFYKTYRDEIVQDEISVWEGHTKIATLESYATQVKSQRLVKSAPNVKKKKGKNKKTAKNLKPKSQESIKSDESIIHNIESPTALGSDWSIGSREGQEEADGEESFDSSIDRNNLELLMKKKSEPIIKENYSETEIFIPPPRERHKYVLTKKLVERSVRVPVLHCFFGEIDGSNSQLSDQQLIYLLRSKDSAIPLYESKKECWADFPRHILVGSIQGQFLPAMDQLLKNVFLPLAERQFHANNIIWEKFDNSNIEKNAEIIDNLIKFQGQEQSSINRSIDINQSHDQVGKIKFTEDLSNLIESVEW